MWQNRKWSHTQLKLSASEKRWVFSGGLNVSGVLAVLIRIGRLFQRFGAATAKARSPLFWAWLWEHLRATGLTGVCWCSAGYGDASPLRIRYERLVKAYDVMERNLPLESCMHLLCWWVKLDPCFNSKRRKGLSSNIVFFFIYLILQLTYYP